MKTKRPTPNNLNKYKKFSSIYNKLLRKAKSTYYHEQFSLAKNNIKETWVLIKSALNKNNVHDDLPEIFINNNMVLKNKKVIADSFNKYFATIGTQLNDSVPPSMHSFTHYLTRGNAHSLFFDPVTEYDTISAAASIKSKTSRDHDNISTKVMKSSIMNIIEPLTYIINLSLSTGIVPNNMKVAKVVPIFKTGEANLFNNYRPISLLPAFSKILEKIVARKLMSFLENTKQLYRHQYGFRKGHSTTQPIIHLLNQIAQENDKSSKNPTMTVFADLSKAFDTISHDILLRKLDNLGIRGIANSWFHSYLSNRTQYMEIFHHKSKYETIKCGVPQGSILGPILFLIYINDIKKLHTS